ncbi:MAG: hypothetical protein WBW73_28385 [Rhodoplanes sp.]
MKHKAARALGIALSLIVFAVGGSQQDGLNLLVQQIRSVGTRQWLGLMAGSIVSSAPVIAPLTERIARSLPGRAASTGESNTSTADSV